MHRRTFLSGLLGVAGAAVGASFATRVEAANAALTPEPGSAGDKAAAPQSVADRLPEDTEIQTVGYRRRRYYRRRYWRRPVVRWRPARRRRVCRITRNRWGRRRRVCWYR